LALRMGNIEGKDGRASSLNDNSASSVGYHSGNIRATDVKMSLPAQADNLTVEGDRIRYRVSESIIGAPGLKTSGAVVTIEAPYLWNQEQYPPAYHVRDLHGNLAQLDIRVEFGLPARLQVDVTRVGAAAQSLIRLGGWVELLGDTQSEFDWMSERLAVIFGQAAEANCKPMIPYPGVVGPLGAYGGARLAMGQGHWLDVDWILSQTPQVRARFNLTMNVSGAREYLIYGDSVSTKAFSSITMPILETVCLNSTMPVAVDSYDLTIMFDDAQNAYIACAHLGVNDRNVTLVQYGQAPTAFAETLWTLPCPHALSP
jgi:hypothetical protein